jgi:CheY-like chemotaxis protein
MAEDKKKRLLIVDDEKNILFLFKEELSDEFNICCCNDSLEALAEYKSFHPDIVITDLKMPKMDGRELAGRIKKQNPKIPIIIISGDPSFSPKEVQHADAGWTKSFAFEGLHHTIQQLLQIPP